MANSNDTVPTQVKEVLHILAQAVAAVQNGIIITDALQPDYPIIYCNPAFEEITGYSQTEILGRNCRFLQGPDTNPAARAQIREAIQNGEECRVILRNYRQDETPFWNDLTISPIRDDTGRLTHFVGIQNDITERKHTEEQLRSSEERFRHVIASISDHIYVTEVSHEGRLTNRYLSPHVESLTGYSFEKLMTDWAFWPSTLIHPDDRALAAAHATRLARGNSAEIEYRIVRADGQMIWVRDSGRVIREGNINVIYGVVSDITARKQAEEALQETVQKLQNAYQQTAIYAQELKAEIWERQRVETALRENEGRLRSVVENAIDGIITIDEQGLIDSFNPAAEKIFGYTAAEIAGQNVKLLMPDLYHSQHDTYLENYLQTGQTKIMGVSREVTGRRKNGSTFPLDLAVSEFFLEKRRLFIGLVRDLTRRHQLETQLRQAQKMETIGRLAGGIAHDFNNILMIILAQTEFLLEHLTVENVHHDEVKQIKEAARQAASLTHQLLAFSRQQPFHVQFLNLNQVVGDMERMLHRLIGENINLTIRLNPDQVWIQMDPGQIQQIIMNLIINAHDAMGQGGQLTIEIESVDLAGSDFFQSLGLMPGLYVLLTVTDTGLGMDSETQSHIFEPFFTTKEVGKGTGLGLSTIYAIVQQNGGYIAVESQLGHGSIFKVYLPQQLINVEPAPADLSGPLPKGDETILLVEDEANVRLVTRRYLQKQGYQVLEAGYAQEALQICQQQEVPINLVIADVIMPDMRGPELVEQLLQIYPSLKFLYISGYANSSHLQGLLDNPSLFLQKPFSSAMLLHKVREILDTPRSENNC